MKCTTAGILVNGEIIKTFEDGIIKAGQWAYLQGYKEGEYKTVLLMPDGSINHRAIIQVYDYVRGNYILENHYTTCGTFHLPFSQYEGDKQYYKEFYNDRIRYKIDAWIEY